MAEVYRVEECTRCPALVECRHNIVNGRGRKGGVMLVGQWPDDYADRGGKALAGQPTMLIERLCETAHVPLQRVWVTNALRCHTPGNRRPTDVEIANCRGHLIEEIRSVQPGVIIALGEVALTSLHSIDGEAFAGFTAAEYQWASDTTVYERELAEWVEAKSANGSRQLKRPDGSKWLKPTKPHVVRKPKTHKFALKDIAGQVFTQVETGIPIIASYHPYYLTHGHWAETQLAKAHFRKAWRILNGEQEEGSLGDYVTISSLKGLHALEDHLERLLHDADVAGAPTPTLWFDLETTGTDWKNDEILCLSVTDRVGFGVVVPILHNVGDGRLEPWWGAKNAKAIKILKRIFALALTKGGHNMLFDTRFLERRADQPWITAATAFGIKVAGDLVDTELKHHAVAETLPHNMTSILSLETDMPYYEEEIHALSDGKKQMRKVPDDVLHFYSAADADGLPRMDEALSQRAADEGVDWVLYNVTFPMLRVCREMEDNGIPIDIEYFERLCAFYKEELALQQEAMYDAYPELGRFRWWYSGNQGRSKGDLSDVLFNQLALPTSKLATKGGKDCPDCTREEPCEKHDQCGAAALTEIYNLTKHPILPMIMGLKRLVKVKGTYLDGDEDRKSKKTKVVKLHGWKKHIKPNGRIHATAKISKVETGRLAFADPSVQNPPKGIHIHPLGAKCSDAKCKAFYRHAHGINSTNAFRDIIASPDPGKVIMNVDWNQLEVWVLAYTLSERYSDETLLNILIAGEDVHTKVARFIWPQDEEMPDWEWREKHGDLRSKAKTFVFGLAYGLTLMGVCLRLHCSEEEGKLLLKRYFQFVPGLENFFADIRRQVTEHGYSENWFRRRRHSPEAGLMKAMGENNLIEGLIREHINFGIQSGGSDLHSIASRLTVVDSPALQSRGVRVILSVHDSLTFEVDAPSFEYVKQTAWIIKDLFEGVAKNLILRDGSRLGWQCPVEVEWGRTWGTPTWKLDAKGQTKEITGLEESDELEEEEEEAA